MKYILWHWWVPFTCGVTVILGVFFLAVQQNYRQTANDPQIQMAEDTANALTRGLEWQSLLTGPAFDIGTSLAPYTIIYDNNGLPVGGNGEYNRELPKIPKGIFDVVKQRGQHRVTWQPDVGVRNAIVVTSFENQKQSGYVMVGRSLREVDNRIKDLALMIGVAWVVVVAGTLIVGVITDR